MLKHYGELALLNRWRIGIIYAVIVGGALTLSALILLTAPIYTASAKVSLLPTDSELTFSRRFVQSTSLNPANLLAQTHIEYMLSREVAESVVDRLLEYHPMDTESAEDVITVSASPMQRFARNVSDMRGALRREYVRLNSGKHVILDPYTNLVQAVQGAIDVDTVEGTYILQLSVSWDDPEIAAVAANLLAEVYVERARRQATEAALGLEEELRTEMARNESSFVELQAQITNLRLARAANISALRVIDPAYPPVYPSFPKVMTNGVLAFLSATMLSAFVLVSADTFSNTLKTSSDLSRVLGTHSLGVVRVRRGGVARGVWRSLRFIRSRLQFYCDPSRSAGATMSLGTDADSDVAARVVTTAIAGRGAKDSQLPNLESLGGVEEGHAGLPDKIPEWLVVAFHANRVSEKELQEIVAELKRRGVGQVFGLLLRR